MFISPLRRRTSHVANIDTSVQLRSCSTRCKRSARSIQANVKHSISVASGRSAVRHSPTILVPLELFYPFSNLSSPLGYTPVRPAPTLNDRLVIHVDPTDKTRVHLLDIENFIPFDFSYPLVLSYRSREWRMATVATSNGTVLPSHLIYPRCFAFEDLVARYNIYPLFLYRRTISVTLDRLIFSTCVFYED